MNINQFNIELGIFLRRFRSFSAQNSIQIDDKSIEMFSEMVMLLDKVIASADHVPTENNECLDFLFDLNDQHFDFRQYIMCRLCIVNSCKPILFSNFMK